jgi:hypothetical protein
MQYRTIFVLATSVLIMVHTDDTADTDDDTDDDTNDDTENTDNIF